MRTRIVAEGNAFYEIDEDCAGKKQKERRNTFSRPKSGDTGGKGTTGSVNGSRIHSGDFDK